MPQMKIFQSMRSSHLKIGKDTMITTLLLAGLFCILC